MMFTREEIKRVGKRLGWEYAVVKAEMKIPDDILEEFVEDMPILHMHLNGMLSKEMNDKFKCLIKHKIFLSNKDFIIPSERPNIPRIPGGRRNNDGFYNVF